MTSAGQQIALRPMQTTDIGPALKLTQQLGWPHSKQDWRFHLDLGAGIAAIGPDGAVIGTTLWWTYGTNAGSLGLIVVDPRYQGRGIGGRLMQRALAEIGPRSLQLVATAVGLKLYQRHGFEPVGMIEQLQGELSAVQALPQAPDTRLRPLQAGDLATLCKLDSRALRLDRSKLLQALLAVADGCVLERGGHPVGFALARAAGRGTTIGPVIAADQSDAKLMLSALLAGRSGFCRIDVPREAGALIAWLQGLGLAPVDEGTMMLNEHARMTHSSPQRCFALVSQAFG